MTPMKILHELGQLECGGVERVVRNLVKYDPVHHHEILAYHDGPMRVELEKVGATVHVCDADSSEMTCEADLLHIHCGGAQSQLAASLHAGFPIVETIHSPLKSPNPPSWIARRVGVTQAVTALNPFAQTIYNGIDLVEMARIAPSGWLRRQLEIPTSRRILGRIGRIAPDKGLEEFLLAAHAVQARGTDVAVVVAGQEAATTRGYVAKMLLMADSLPVADFHYVGFQRAADFLAELDLFVYPSPTEGFGLVYAEAMAMGVPIVAWDVPAVREVIGGHAILTPTTVAALAGGIEAVLTQPTLQEALVQGARETVEDLFSAERMSAEYQALYEDVHAQRQLREHPQSLRENLATR